MKNYFIDIRNKVRNVRGRIYNRRTAMKARPWRYNKQIKQNIIDQFHRLYFDGYATGTTWSDTYWRGVRTEKCPLDMWIYQEILFKTKPDLIIETGTRFGGSALFMADILKLSGKGKIVTIDIEAEENLPEHEKISYLTGSSTSEEIIRKIKSIIRPDDSVMVILDSDHSKDHVLKELEIFNHFVSPGNYLIVEDTNINGHPIAEDFGPGPMEALEAFLKNNNDFSIDDNKEKFYLTFSPRGYLKKKSNHTK